MTESDRLKKRLEMILQSENIYTEIEKQANEGGNGRSKELKR